MMDDEKKAVGPTQDGIATVVMETSLAASQLDFDAVSVFYHALVETDMAVIKNLLECKKIDVNMLFHDKFEFIQPAYRGWGAIHIITRRGVVDFLNFIVNQGADVSLQNKDGDIPLHIASRYGQAHCVTYLLKCNADLKDAVNNQGLTPLVRAVFKFEHAFKGQYHKTVKALLAAGCDANICSSLHVTPLHLAAAMGNASLSQLLIQGGADVNLVCSQGASPLLKAMYAVRVNVQCVNVLLEAGADVNIATISGRTILHLAVSKCDDKCVESILNAGADPNAKDNYSKTPLWIAVEENNVHVVSLLAKYGGDINYSLPPQRLSLLSLAITCQSVNMVNLLLSLGASVITETAMGATPLSLAADAQSIPIIRALLRENCLLDVVGNSKHSFIPQTPLQIAFEHGNLQVIKLLMRAGCMVDRVWLKSNNLPPCLFNNSDSLMWIEDFFYTVKPLMHTCRVSIRKMLVPNFRTKLDKLSEDLMLPKRMIEYLKLTDLLDQ